MNTNNNANKYDVIIIGSGGAGIMSALSISYNTNYKNILIIEKLSYLASKLKASGGGKCNLTNMLPKDEFLEGFWKNAKFVRNIIDNFDNKDLIKFFDKIGLETNSLDGFRVFPASKNSKSVINALQNELKKQNIKIHFDELATKILTNNKKDNQIIGLKTSKQTYQTDNIVVATGGKGFTKLGGGDDGYNLIKDLGHTITPLYPAMLPLITKEKWVANCTADTIAKASIKCDKIKKQIFKGDLIFTKNGIRGPIVLDMAREISPLLENHKDNKEVEIKVNMTQITNEEKLYQFIKNEASNSKNIFEIVTKLLPISVATEILKIVGIEPNIYLKQIKGIKKEELIKTLLWTPLTIIDTFGFENAMVTRGGIKLSEIDSKTMQSKLIDGLYFCGEVVDIDGKCGGYNLQWAFSSGYLVGKNIGDKCRKNNSDSRGKSL